MERYEITLADQELTEVEQSVSEELADLLTGNRFEVLEIGIPAILTFSLGGITIGFLEEIGKIILDKLRDYFFASDLDLKTPKLEFEFKYQETRIIAEVESSEQSDFKEVFTSFEQLLDKLANLDKDWREIEELRLRLDLAKGVWKKVE